MRNLFDTRRQLVEEYVQLSVAVSPDYSFVQGGGGNVSVKTDELIVIKASGTRLNEATLSSGYVLLDRPASHSAATAGRPLENSLNDFSPPGRPSIEAPLHAVCPGLYTAHVHSAGAIAIGLTSEAALVCELFGWEFINYSCPGQPLLERLLECEYFQLPEGTILLGNHGLLSWATSMKDCQRRVIETENVCREHLLSRRVGRGNPDEPLSLVTAEVPMVDFSGCLDSQWLEFCLETTLVPDQIVLLGSIDFSSRVSDSLLFDLSNMPRDRQEMIKLLQLLGQLITISECTQVLTDIQIHEIITMEAEHYRQGKIK